MKPGIPQDTRIYAIGDIHGCHDLLEDLLQQILRDDSGRPCAERKILVFLGDYIDRGPCSAEVIDHLLHALPTGFEKVFLKGNHEVMLLDALENPQTELPALFWLRNGGYETLISYNTGDVKPNDQLAPRELMQSLAANLPPEHQAFFNSLQSSFRCGDYFFVHAGIHPDRPLNKQRERDMMWIRDRFLFSEKDFGKIIVHGHTPMKDVDIADNRIGIDTAAVYGGMLTALMLEGHQRKLFHAHAVKKNL